MKRETIIFKLAGLFLLMALIGLMLSCQKVERDFEWPYKYKGTCKILQYNQNNDWNGKAVFIGSDSLTIEQLESTINNCELMGGSFILDNDSSGRMCYTCQSQKWFPN